MDAEGLNPQKACLYDPAWQAVRIQCKGLWGDKAGASAATTILAHYVQDQKYTITAYWRILNLLNATRMGYHGQGLVGSDMDKTVRGMQSVASANYKHKVKKVTGGRGKVRFDVLTDAQTRAAWQELDTETRHRILLDLRKRWDTHPNIKNRPELHHFLQLVGGLE